MKNKHTKNILTRLSIALIVAIIVSIYYFTELRPFQYVGYENKIDRLQRFDAELNEAIVKSRFGILRYYDPIDKTLDGVESVLHTFKTDLAKHPNLLIEKKLQTLEKAINVKVEITHNFKRYNPILINAINQFSTLLAQIIEAQANSQLVENALDITQQLEHSLEYQIMDKINNLFSGILVYINLKNEEKHQGLVNLVQELRKAPKNEEKYPKLEIALSYADMILDLQPKLTKIDAELYDVPIVANLNLLNYAFKENYQQYLHQSHALRIILYILVFILLVILRWAFSQLRGTVNTLHIEVQHKIKAEKELAEINRQLEQRVAQRTVELTVKNNDLNRALGDLKEAQEQLIIKEKMASVGMLTTGIAHEIKNPLNFVNNFSDISVDLVKELKEEININKQKFDEDSLKIITDIMQDLKTNCEKIKEHGERADNIVKTMLLHSQEANVQKEMLDIKSLVTDSYQIALEAFRTAHGKFDIKLDKNEDAALPKILGAPQSIGRALVYIFDNALFALRERLIQSPTDFSPSLIVNLTKQEENAVIKIRDNGIGITKKLLDKVFEPFFTTKPTGKGNTGLGLSICYDTIVKQHKGELKVASEEGIYTEFTIVLPITAKKL